MHTSVFIVSLSKWSLTFKIIPGVPPRKDLILLVLICRVTPNDYKVVGTDTYSTSHQPYICIPRIMKTNTRLYSVLNCTVHASVCRRFVCQRFWSLDVLICRRFGWFGLSTFWSVDVSVCRRFGLLMFWYVDVLFCRRFSLSTFWSVDISVSQCFGLSTFWLSTFRFFGFSTFWPATYKRAHFDTPNPVYKYGHHFAVDISEWISSMAFFIISLSLSFTS